MLYLVLIKFRLIVSQPAEIKIVENNKKHAKEYFSFVSIMLQLSLAQYVPRIIVGL